MLYYNKREELEERLDSIWLSFTPLFTEPIFSEYLCEPGAVLGTGYERCGINRAFSLVTLQQNECIKVRSEDIKRIRPLSYNRKLNW